MKTGRIRVLLTAVALSSALAGCSALTAMDQTEATGVGVEEVLAMSKAGVQSSTIIRKLEITKSEFHLTNDDIIRLKNEDVSDDVVTFMLGANEEARQADLETGRRYYEKSFDYFMTYYPAMLPFDRFFPVMNYSYGPFKGARYRWSGNEGAYYRDFPVGIPGKYRGRASQFPGNVERRDSKNEDEK